MADLAKQLRQINDAQRLRELAHNTVMVSHQAKR
jgi:hypothetical protein